MNTEQKILDCLYIHPVLSAIAISQTICEPLPITVKALLKLVHKKRVRKINIPLPGDDITDRVPDKYTLPKKIKYVQQNLF